MNAPSRRSLAIASAATGAVIALLATLLLRNVGDLEPRRPSAMELDEPAPGQSALP